MAEKLDPSQVVTFMEAIHKRGIVCQSVMETAIARKRRIWLYPQS